MNDESTGLPVRGFDAAQLPEFAPDAQLWQRIAGAQQRRVTVRRRRRVFALATAAVAVLAVAMGGLVPRPLLSTLSPPAASAMVEGQRESQSLESEWQQLASNDSAPPSGLTRLRFIDATLQSAYDRGADSEEIVALWKQRNRALRGLIAEWRAVDARGALAVTQI